MIVGFDHVFGQNDQFRTVCEIYFCIDLDVESRDHIKNGA